MLNNRLVTSNAPEWLDGEQQQAWMALVRLMIRLPAALDAQLQGDAGISHFEYQILAGLSMAPERRLRMGELAQFTEGSLARLSQAAGRLEGRGWLRRKPDPADGRSTLALLTDEGLDKVIESAPGHVQAVRNLVFTSLSRAQARQLTAIAQSVLKAIDDHPRPARKSS